MPLEKLTEKQVRTARRAGLLNDGGGLYLAVAPTGSKSFVFRYTIDGRQRRMGLGGIDTIDLQAAREIARECRKLLAEGIDPIDRRRVERAVAAKNREHTVRTAMLEFIERRKAVWCPEYARQVPVQFERHVFPKIGNLSIQAANDTGVILSVIEPLWNTRNQTMWRLRGLLENLIDWAKFRGYCTGENAARWKGHLAFHLPAPSKVRHVRHHPALPYRDVPEFVRKLRQHRGMIAIALEFTILTAGRQKEIRFARWREFDLDAKLWTIPAERMKTKRPHRVHLSEPMLAVLREVAWLKERDDDLVFPGWKPGCPVGQHNAKLLMMDMGYGSIATPHGFRSSFKDWATEQTDFRTEAIDLALAHAVGSKEAYRRGDLLEQRRLLSEAWGEFCVSLCAVSNGYISYTPERSVSPANRPTTASVRASTVGRHFDRRGPLSAR